MSPHPDFMLAIMEIIETNKNFNRQEAALLKLIFVTMYRAHHKYFADASAARYGFVFGICAQENLQRLTAAITLLEKIVTSYVSPTLGNKKRRS